MSGRRLILVALAGVLVGLGLAGAALSTTHGTNGLIVYGQQVNGRYQLFTIRPDGSGGRQITRGFEWSNPDWSPNGGSIVAERSGPNAANIVTVTVGGKLLRNLTPKGFQGQPNPPSHRVGRGSRTSGTSPSATTASG